MEGEAGGGEEPGFPVAGEALDAGGLGGGQLDRGNAGRAGLAAPDGDRRAVPVELQVKGRVSAACSVLPGGCGVRPGGGSRGGAGEGGADGGGPELGEGGQGGVPADRVPSAGLGGVPAEGVFSGFESDFNRPPVMPVKQKSSLA